MAASCYGMLAISSVSPVTRRSSFNQVFGFSKYGSSVKGDVKFTIRSMAEEEAIKEQAQVPRKPTPSPKPKMSTSFSDVLAFSWPGAERINGRLAMIGFVAALGVEIANGQDVFSQVRNGGIPWLLGTTVLVSVASLIPMFKGVSVESRSGEFFTSDAELWNGRFAMLGFVALLFTEFVKDGALL